MNRQEHLDWCKTRALECLDRGDLREAVTSMMSDMDKHDETRLSGVLAALALFELTNGTLESVRRFIEGFN